MRRPRPTERRSVLWHDEITHVSNDRLTELLAMADELVAERVVLSRAQFIGDWDLPAPATIEPVEPTHARQLNSIRDQDFVDALYHGLTSPGAPLTDHPDIGYTEPTRQEKNTKPMTQHAPYTNKQISAYLLNQSRRSGLPYNYLITLLASKPTVDGQLWNSSMAIHALQRFCRARGEGFTGELSKLVDDIASGQVRKWYGSDPGACLVLNATQYADKVGALVPISLVGGEMFFGMMASYIDRGVDSRLFTDPISGRPHYMAIGKFDDRGVFKGRADTDWKMSPDGDGMVLAYRDTRDYFLGRLTKVKATKHAARLEALGYHSHAKGLLMQIAPVELQVLTTPSEIRAAYKEYSPPGNCMRHSAGVFQGAGGSARKVHPARCYGGDHEGAVHMVVAIIGGKMVGRGLILAGTKTMLRWFTDYGRTYKAVEDAGYTYVENQDELDGKVWLHVHRLAGGHILCPYIDPPHIRKTFSLKTGTDGVEYLVLDENGPYAFTGYESMTVKLGWLDDDGCFRDQDSADYDSDDD